MAATAMGAGVALWWGWSAAEVVVFGLALSVASTVVLLVLLPRMAALAGPGGGSLGPEF